MAEEHNPYAAPRAEILESAPTGEECLAGRGQRLAAATLDGLILSLITYPILAFLVYPTVFGSTPGFAGYFQALGAHVSYTQTLLGTFFSFLVFLPVFLLLNLSLLMRAGQTIGKKLVGIRIETQNGARLSGSQLIRRYGFMYCVPLIPLVGPLINLANILCIFRASRRCLHDDVAGTIVVRA